MEEEEEEFRNNDDTKPKAGRPRKSMGSDAERAQKRKRKSRAKAHVELAEQWPVFQGRGLIASASSRPGA